MSHEGKGEEEEEEEEEEEDDDDDDDGEELLAVAADVSNTSEPTRSSRESLWDMPPPPPPEGLGIHLDGSCGATPPGDAWPLASMEKGASLVAPAMSEQRGGELRPSAPSREVAPRGAAPSPRPSMNDATRAAILARYQTQSLPRRAESSGAGASSEVQKVHSNSVPSRAGESRSAVVRRAHGRGGHGASSELGAPNDAGREREARRGLRKCRRRGGVWWRRDPFRVLHFAFG